MYFYRLYIGYIWTEKLYMGYIRAKKPLKMYTGFHAPSLSTARQEKSNSLVERLEYNVV